MITIKSITKDMQSFADDESQVIVEKNGSVLLRRQDKDILFKIITDENGGIQIEYDSQLKPYKTFLAQDIAKLDTFANKLLEKRPGITSFIDSQGTLSTLEETLTQGCLSLINKTCQDKLYATKVTFITADAGHGKTALLKEFQNIQAQNFIDRRSNFLFWHIDLQGRELVRLNEAIMYDIGELRVAGSALYYSSIMSLVRNGILVLAIDGFDELAAEIGGEVALGSLSHLVTQLDNQGTIVAASRRTFFNTQDYVKRNSILRSSVSTDSEFHELKLENWNKENATEYINKAKVKNAETLYEDLLLELHGNSDHPILTRPFLFTKIVDILKADTNLNPSSIVKGIESPTEGVAEVVEAFTQREVNKWKLRDSETGKPYLEYEQHITLLELIAEEMWLSQNENMSSEDIEYFVTDLCAEWKIETKSQQRIVSMAKAHALLVPSDIDNQARKFEHEEFKNYFIARALARRIKSANHNVIRNFLYVAQLPDSVAQFACTFIEKEEDAILDHLHVLHTIIKEEWKPTYLQSNIGTLIPYLINGVKFTAPIYISDKVNYLSLVFESKKLENVIFENGTFINISFRNTKLTNVKFINCVFNELRIYSNSENAFENVEFEDCSISHLIDNGEDDLTIAYYNPDKIISHLYSYNISFPKPNNSSIETTVVIPKISEFKKSLLRFLNIYRKTTIQYESNIKNDTSQYKAYKNIFLNEIIPFLEKKEIIEVRDKSKNAKQVLFNAWSLKVDLDDLLKYDGVNDGSFYSNFWNEVNNK